jgi:hypothetical protein
MAATAARPARTMDTNPPMLWFRLGAFSSPITTLVKVARVLRGLTRRPGRQRHRLPVIAWRMADGVPAVNAAGRGGLERSAPMWGGAHL